MYALLSLIGSSSTFWHFCKQTSMHSFQNVNILLLVIFQVKPFISKLSFLFFFSIWLPVDFHPLGKSFHPIMSSLTLSNQGMTHGFLV